MNSMHGTITLLAGCLLLAGGCLARAQAPAKPAPTSADVNYGEHPRQVLDFWKADSAAPTPLAVYIHGGGFRGGDKNTLNADVLRRLLAGGISVAAIHYRMLPQHLLPAAHADAARAIQFLRSKAQAWNIDKTRVGAFGGSAGAQLCMYLGFHDELAKPASSDPVERESTRLTAIATSGGQTTMDREWWKAKIPGYLTLRRDDSELYGKIPEQKMRALIQEISAFTHLTRDDPPIFMSYGMAPGDDMPADAKRAENWIVHHVNFGIELKKRMDELGMEAYLKYPRAEARYSSPAEFFLDKLRKPRP